MQYTQYQNMSIADTFFKKNHNRNWTWKTSNETTKNEIDFIFTNKIAFSIISELAVTIEQKAVSKITERKIA